MILEDFAYFFMKIYKMKSSVMKKYGKEFKSHFAKFILRTLSFQNFTYDNVVEIIFKRMLSNKSMLEDLLNTTTHEVSFNETFLFWSSKVLMDNNPNISKELKKYTWQIWKQMAISGTVNVLNSPYLHKNMKSSSNSNPHQKLKEGISIQKNYESNIQTQELFLKEIENENEKFVPVIFTCFDGQEASNFDQEIKIFIEKFRKNSKENYLKYQNKNIHRVLTDAKTNILEKKFSLEKKQLNVMRERKIGLRSLIKVWKYLTKKILNERGIFCSPERKWKFDAQEGPNRIRIRLKPIIHYPISLPAILWKLLKQGNNDTSNCKKKKKKKKICFYINSYFNLLQLSLLPPTKTLYGFPKSAKLSSSTTQKKEKLF